MIIQLLAALVGSLGFAALFNLHGKKLIVSALGGLGAWAVYLALNSVLTNANLSALITCALITPNFSPEKCARRRSYSWSSPRFR